MTKEKIFNDLKDVIKTLRGSNFEHPEIRLKWKEKVDLLEKGISGLNSCDMLWLSAMYSEWFKKDIYPYLTDKQKEIIEDQKLNW